MECPIGCGDPPITIKARPTGALNQRFAARRQRVTIRLRPIKVDEGAAGAWRGTNDLRRAFNRSVFSSPD
jgi:hypothetical protein